MKRINITLEDNLLEEIDRAVRMLNKSRSAFLRDCAKIQLRKLKFAEMDRQYAESYANLPLQPDELDDWSEVQDWGDDYEPGH